MCVCVCVRGCLLIVCFCLTMWCIVNLKNTSKQAQTPIVVKLGNVFSMGVK